MSEHDEAQQRELEQASQRKKRGYKPGGPAGRMIVTEKPRDFKGTVAKLIKFMGRFKFAMAVALLFAIGAIFAPQIGMGVLTDNPVLHEIGVKYVFIMAFAQPPQVMAKLYTGMTRAAGFKRVPMTVSFIGIWCVRVPLALLAAKVLHLDITAIWWAISIDQLVRISISIGYFYKKDILHTIDRLPPMEEAMA